MQLALKSIKCVGMPSQLQKSLEYHRPRGMFTIKLTLGEVKEMICCIPVSHPGSLDVHFLHLRGSRR